jgi:hypothetical protein
MVPNVRRTHFSVGSDAVLGKALALNHPGVLHPAAHHLRRLTQPLVGELIVIDARHFDVNIDPVEQRAGNAFLVFGDSRVGTGAGLDRVAEIAARAGIPHITTLNALCLVVQQLMGEFAGGMRHERWSCYLLEKVVLGNPSGPLTR